MTLDTLDTLEERIQKPGYLLLLVVVLLFLIVGLVDLLDTISNDPVLFGRYSLRYFAIILIYTIFLLAWAALLLRPNDDRWLTKTLDFIQKRPPLALLFLASIVALFFIILPPQSRVNKLLLEFPALQATILVIALLSGGLLLFYKWGDETRPQLWRKVVVALLTLLIIVEIVIQLLASLGIMPSLSSTMDAYAPYTRIYHTEEGLGNGLTNKYGRYTTEFQLLPDSHRIAVVGDSFIQGLQVSKEENLGVQLEQQINEQDNGDQVTEVLTLGYPDYGPGMYLSNWMLAVANREFEPDETIIFFDLGSDFQTIDGPGQGLPYFTYAGQGRVQLDLTNFFTDLHNAEHVVHHGYEGFQLVRILRSHYLTPRFLLQLFAEPTVAAASNVKSSETPEQLDESLFNPATNQEALLIAASQINMANQQLGLYDVGTSLVTIPAFNEAFYEQDGWNTTFDAVDLLLPERQLRTSAANYGIPFLGLGAYMEAKGLAPSDVQALYYADGLGHFTAAGHALAAEAVYECFFARSLSAEEGCDLP